MEEKAREKEFSAEHSSAQQVALELARAFRAMELYPPAHPQLRSILKASFQKIHPLLTGFSELVFSVKRDGIYFQGKPLSAQIQALGQFARELHIRQFKTFAFRPELSEREFMDFLRLLIIPSEEFRSGKKIEEYFREKKITSIWVNEVDFKKVFLGERGAERKESEQEAQPDEQEEKAEQEFIQLSRLVQALDLAGEDSQAEQILAQIEPEVERCLSEKKFPELWYLAGEVSYFLEEKKEHFPRAGEKSQSLLKKLAQPEFLNWLLDRFLASDPDSSYAFLRFFQQTKNQTLPLMLQRIMKPEAVYFQKPLLDFLVGEKDSARELIESQLASAPSAGLRKLVYLLGEIRSPQSVEKITPFLHHPEPAIQREAIRALGKIRAQASSLALAGLLGEKNLEEESKLILIQILGERGELLSVPRLMEIAQNKSEPLSVREKAVEALGKIGSREAIPALERILKKTGWFQKPPPDSLRVKALETMVKLSPARAREWLARYSEMPGLVGEYAQKFLAQLENQGANK